MRAFLRQTHKRLHGGRGADHNKHYDLRNFAGGYVHFFTYGNFACRHGGIKMENINYLYMKQ